MLYVNDDNAVYDDVSSFEDEEYIVDLTHCQHKKANV